MENVEPEILDALHVALMIRGEQLRKMRFKSTLFADIELRKEILVQIDFTSGGVLYLTIWENLEQEISDVFYTQTA